MTAQPLSLPAEVLPTEAEAGATRHGRHGTLTVAASGTATAPASGLSPSPADSATARFFASWLARTHPGTAWEVEIDLRPRPDTHDAENVGAAA